MKQLALFAAVATIATCIGFAWGRQTAEQSPVRRFVEFDPSTHELTALYWPLESVDDDGRLHIRFAPRRLQPETVRLRGIYIPQQGEPLHQEAVEAILEMVAGSPVALDFDGDDVRRDSFGRLMAFAWTVVIEEEEEGEDEADDAEDKPEPTAVVATDVVEREVVQELCINLELVRRGLARFVRQEGGSMAGEFESAERAARDAGRGIWANDESNPDATAGD